MADPIRIAVIDGDPLYRRGLVETIAGPRMAVVAEGETAEDARQVVQAAKPDILIFDTGACGDGIGAAESVMRLRPGIRIIILTASDDEEDVADALRVGVPGYILKGVRGPDLLNAIETVHAGEPYITPGLASRLLVQTRGKLLRSQDKMGTVELTVRDRRVLRNLARGLSNRELASEFGVSVRTIKYYVSQVLRKMHVNSRFKAILEAQKMRLDLSD